MSEFHQINQDTLTLEAVEKLLSDDKKLQLSVSSKSKIVSCRKYLDEKLAKEERPIYGVNTGFGSLCDVQISKQEIEQLQFNLVVSHACGVGDEISQEIARLMIFLKIQSLAYGYSGISLQTVERLIHFYNRNITPVIFEMGSLGASGDLAPLAHLSLPLLGLGDVYFNGKKMPAAKVLQTEQLSALKLQSKEGLALLNGTQFMSAFGVYVLIESYKISRLANLTAAISLDAFNCLREPLNPLIHMVRPHTGQQKTAEEILEILAGSKIWEAQKSQVQDPYSFRCIPQVHGTTLDVIAHVESVFTTEINSVTDNPNIFVEEDEILSGGNFHGQPLALALDYLSLGLAELGNISERRTYFLLSGSRDLPPFLAKNPGLNSGLMIPQYTAASLVSQNKQLATPASVDSIDSSNRQEDHVSMGANAATKCYKILKNLQRIIAIEFLTATQALEFRRPLKSSVKIEEIISSYRQSVSFMENDRVLFEDINKTISFLQEVEK